MAVRADQDFQKLVAIWHKLVDCLDNLDGNTLDFIVVCLEFMDEYNNYLNAVHGRYRRTDLIVNADSDEMRSADSDSEHSEDIPPAEKPERQYDALKVQAAFGLAAAEVAELADYDIDARIVERHSLELPLILHELSSDKKLTLDVKLAKVISAFAESIDSIRNNPPKKYQKLLCPGVAEIVDDEAVLSKADGAAFLNRSIALANITNLLVELDNFSGSVSLRPGFTAALLNRFTNSDAQAKLNNSMLSAWKSLMDAVDALPTKNVATVEENKAFLNALSDFCESVNHHVSTKLAATAKLRLKVDCNDKLLLESLGLANWQLIRSAFMQHQPKNTAHFVKTLLSIKTEIDTAIAKPNNNLKNSLKDPKKNEVFWQQVTTLQSIIEHIDEASGNALHNEDVGVITLKYIAGSAEALPEPDVTSANLIENLKTYKLDHFLEESAFISWSESLITQLCLYVTDNPTIDIMHDNHHVVNRLMDTTLDLLLNKRERSTIDRMLELAIEIVESPIGHGKLNKQLLAVLCKCPALNGINPSKTSKKHLVYLLKDYRNTANYVNLNRFYVSLDQEITLAHLPHIDEQENSPPAFIDEAAMRRLRHWNQKNNRLRPEQAAPQPKKVAKKCIYNRDIEARLEKLPMRIIQSHIQRLPDTFIWKFKQWFQDLLRRIVGRRTAKSKAQTQLLNDIAKQQRLTDEMRARYRPLLRRSEVSD